MMFSLRNMIVDYYVNDISCDYDIDLMQDFVNTINENMFDIKKSGNPKVFIEMLLIKYMREHNNGVNEIKKTDVKSSSIDENAASEDVESEMSANSYDVSEKIISREIISDCPIKNIKEIMNVRVNNVMAQADKNLLKMEIEKFDLLNDYAFDQEIGYLVCSLLDAKVRAVSDFGIILSYEYESTVKQNLANLRKIIDVYNKITSSNKLIAIISDDQWNEEKNKYIKSLKEGKKYQILEEPVEVLEEVNKNDIIGSSAMDLFGDIVEVE